MEPTGEPGSYLGEHWQLLGKVHHARDGRGHDLGELAEGLQVHLVAVAGGHHGTLADVIGLLGGRRGWGGHRGRGVEPTSA